MANKSLRCKRAEGEANSLTKNKKSTSEILAAMAHYQLMDLLKAKRCGELNHVCQILFYALDYSCDV
jgi:hypothetical protein